ncbi:RdRp [Wilkie partiti-like virus 2]|uniref:RdRp n=1 Tax=Wilkie partiti-like virus 2 TaxID=2010284 RepID=UPI000B4F7AFC|nr:RdRp [Wilkie partiti-like virus 2]ASA47452.1 RdRp [Wilkie partiti-like virus 2]
MNSYALNNIIRTSLPNKERSFRIPDANHKPEKFALKSIELIKGSKYADDVTQNYKRAEITNESLISDLYRNNGPGVPHCQDVSYIRALKLLSSKLLDNGEKLKTVHFTAVRMYDLNKSGSAELPYVEDAEFINYVHSRFRLGEIENLSLSKGNGWNMILEKERIKIHQIKDKRLPFIKMVHDTRMHARSHLTTVEKADKVRAVYGVCCTIILAEIMILWPLINRIKSMNDPFIAWGFETFRGGLQKIRERVCEYDVHLNLDFSTFDKLIPFWLIDDIHQVWKENYEIGPYYEDDPRYPRPKTTPERINNIWEFVNFSTKHTPYRAPDGSRYLRKHSGIASGQLQTQLLGSCVNYVIIVSALLDFGLSEDQFKVYVMGDDSLISIRYVNDPKIILSHISVYVKHNFNAIVNPDKCSISVGPDSIQFLGYKFKDGAITRVNNDLLAKLVYPEKAHFTLESTKSRAAGILLANLGYDLDIHVICCNILRKLESTAINLKGLNWHDRKRIEYYISNFIDTPTRDDLFRTALTPQDYPGDQNWRKFLR